MSNVNEIDSLELYIKLMEERPEYFKNVTQLIIEKDITNIKEYMKKTGIAIGVVYKSPYSLLVVDLIKDDKGGYYTYERLLPSVKEGAVVMRTMCNGKHVLLKQYRHAIRDYQYSYPRGFGEMGLSSEENVSKELYEEIGCRPSSIKRIGEVVADSGICGNKIDVYQCNVDYVNITIFNEGIEDVVLLEDEEMERWIKEGKINDGLTLAVYELGK